MRPIKVGPLVFVMTSLSLSTSAFQCRSQLFWEASRARKAGFPRSDIRISSQLLTTRIASPSKWASHGSSKPHCLSSRTTAMPST